MQGGEFRLGTVSIYMATNMAKQTSIIAFSFLFAMQLTV
jgi:hypothetical protein